MTGQAGCVPLNILRPGFTQFPHRILQRFQKSGSTLAALTADHRRRHRLPSPASR
jgi:hypothetical protein